MRRWRPHNDTRKAAIFVATAELLENSDTELSVQLIAQRAGVPKSSVYRQFKGRDDLYAQARAYLVDELAAALESSMDVSTGSIHQILERTIATTARWALEHPRWFEFARSGPRHDTDADLDAMGALQLRITHSAQTILFALAEQVGAPIESVAILPAAVVHMVEGTVREWSRGTENIGSVDNLVAELTDLAWYMIDGRARAVGLPLDPDEAIPALVARLGQVSVTSS